MSLTLIEGALKNYGPISDVIINQVKRVRDFLANRRRWTVSFTGTRSVFESVNKHLTRWSSRMKDEAIRDVPIPYTPYAGAQPRDGLAGAMKVSYCTKVMTAPHISHPDAPLVTLGTYLARFDYFLPEIRLKGNAYGGGANIDDTTGTFSLFSYRDPRIVETLAVFDGLRAFVESANWSQADVDRAIIGVAKSAERPIRPGEATGTALWRHVRGDTNEMRERRYALTLAATPATIKTAFLRTLDEHEKTAAVCVASSAENLVAANKRLGKAALALQNILP
jgi:Zn-dependent M16 (insulinase) family peptidase